MDMATLQAMIKTAQLQGQSPFGANPQGAATLNPMMAAQFARQRANLTQPTSVMDERYPAWKKAQDDADKFMLLSDVIGAAVPLAGPAARMGVAGVKSMAPQAANMAEGYMARTGMLQPITAYHGSPHKFDAFDSSKIGTGEGAQAYGHGLYFAENPTVAKEYQKTLTSENGFLLDGKKMTRKEVQDALNAERSGFLDGVSRPSGVADYHMDALSNASFGKPKRYADGTERGAYWESLQNRLSKEDHGHLYTVDLSDAHIAKMLDWDKPLSQQPKGVQARFESMVAPMRQEMAKAAPGWGDLAAPTKFDPTGEELLAMLRNPNARMNPDSITANGLSADISANLREAGIPGIKYLDGGSRGAGSGTRNFVVFPGEEKALKILERK